MFSMMPSIGTSTLRNMLMPLRASISARSCGVETMTAPASGTCWAMVSWASPVPGGMSTTITSSSPQATSRSICISACMTIGPAPDHRRLLVDEEAHRHDLDAVAFHRLQRAPVNRLRPSGNAHQARHRRAVDIGVENADLQAVQRWSPRARLAAVVDLPTPPLPDATAMIAPTPGTPCAGALPPACCAGGA